MRYANGVPFLWIPSETIQVSVNSAKTERHYVREGTRLPVV